MTCLFCGFPKESFVVSGRIRNFASEYNYYEQVRNSIPHGMYKCFWASFLNDAEGCFPLSARAQGIGVPN
jgi:hypothetical protein